MTGCIYEAWAAVVDGVGGICEDTGGVGVEPAVVVHAGGGSARIENGAAGGVPQVVL